MKNKLKQLLTASVHKNQARGLLFSGGLDSSIIAAINPRVKAINVRFENYGEDTEYAESVSKFLKMEYFQRKVKIEEAIAAIPRVIKILESFDPAIPNDLTAYFGLKTAKESGIDEIMTGDASDEIFAGYSFMRGIDDLDGYIRKISSLWLFSSRKLGEFLDIKIKQPYLDKTIVDFGLDIPKNMKIRRDRNRVWGKWILRKAFEDALPGDIIWQSKRPLEHGSGMTKIRGIIESKIADKEFKEASKELSIKFISKEHFYYYKVYRDVIGEISGPAKGEKECPSCGAGMRQQAFHCKVCGHVLN
ncbi:MAG: asparagine synthase C-terminal domain-containing protein [Candidatus Omnitrophota bacterium]